MNAQEIIELLEEHIDSAETKAIKDKLLALTELIQSNCLADDAVAHGQVLACQGHMIDNIAEDLRRLECAVDKLTHPVVTTGGMSEIDHGEAARAENGLSNLRTAHNNLLNRFEENQRRADGGPNLKRYLSLEKRIDRMIPWLVFVSAAGVIAVGTALLNLWAMLPLSW